MEVERLKHDLATSRESEMRLMKLGVDMKRAECEDLVIKTSQTLLLRHANRKLKVKLLETLQQLDLSVPLDARMQFQAAVYSYLVQAFLQLVGEHEHMRSEVEKQTNPRSPADWNYNSELDDARHNSMHWMDKYWHLLTLTIVVQPFLDTLSFLRRCMG